MSEASSFGAVQPVRLRQAREAAGLHIAALAAALKVPVRKLEALEAGRYEDLPDLTFARALASSACRHLKVDPVAILEEIPHPDEPHLSQFPKAISAPFRTPPSESGAGGSGAGLKLAVWVAGGLLVAALGLFLMPDPAPWTGWLSREAPSSSAGAGLVVEPAAPAGEVSQPVLPALDPSASEAPVSPGMAPQPGSSGQEGQAEPVASAVATPPSVASPAAGGLLVLRARGDSWVEVVNGSGGVVIQRMVRAGDVLDFSSSPPYSVVIGRADQVDVIVRGRPMDLVPMTRNSVARFEVK